MRHLFSFLLMCVVKGLSHLFYRLNHQWVGSHDVQVWSSTKLIVFLHHTSLYEPLFIMALPWSYLWTISGKMVAPGADKTLNRPIVGFFYKNLSPQVISITRKKDDTWKKFLKEIAKDSVIVIAPEGRMKRENDLDSNGKPMSVRGGVADILDVLEEGSMVLAYSGGLHHVQIPGQFIPGIFKTIHLNTEQIDIKKYKEVLKEENPSLRFKKAVTQDLERRMALNIPESKENSNPYQHLNSQM